MAKIETFSDAFNQTTLNTGSWTQFTASGGTASYSASGASLNYPSPTSTSNDADITSVSTYDLTGSYGLLQVTGAPSGTNSDATFALQAGSNTNRVHWQQEGTNLFAAYIVSGSQTILATLTYSAATHKWWRIRESGGSTFWDTSTDGITWANRASTTNKITLTALSVQMAATSFGADTGLSAFSFNNFNVPPGTTARYMPVRIPNKFVGPMALRHNFRMPQTTRTAYAPQVYTQTMTATLSSTGSQSRATNKGMTATGSFTGSFSRSTSRAITAALSFSGSQIRRISKVVASGLSFAVAPDQTGGGFSSGYFGGAYFGQGYIGALGAGFTKRINKSTSAALSFSGSTTKQLARSLASAGVSFSGSFGPKAITKAIAATLSFTGSTAKSLTKSLSVAMLSFSGATVRLINKTLTAASLTFVGSVTRRIGKGLSASVSFVGSVVRSITHTTTASLSFVGSTVRSVAKGLTAATVSFGGSVAKQTAKIFNGTLSFTGSIRRAVGKALTAAASFSGSIARSIAKSVTASLTFTGSTLKSIAKAPFAAIVNFTGSLITGTAHYKTLTGVLSFSGIQSRSISKAVAANLSFAGNANKSLAKTMPAATLSSTGAIAKQTNKAFSGISSFVGSFGPKTVGKALTAAVSFTGSQTRSIGKGMNATVAFSGNVLKQVQRKLSGVLSMLVGSSSSISRITSQDANGAGTSSVSVSYPGSTGAGHLLIAMATGYGDTQPAISTSGWSTLITGGSSQIKGGIFYKLADGTETSVTATGSSFGVSLGIFEYSGNANPIVTDGTAGTNNNGSGFASSWTTPSITTTNANDLILSLVATGSAPSSYSWSKSTLIGLSTGSNYRVVGGQNIVSSTQSGYTDTLSWTSAVNVAGFIGAFQAAPGANGLLKQVGKNLSGSLSFTGAISRGVVAIKTAVLSFAGNLTTIRTGNSLKTFAATLSFNGSMTRATARSVSGALSFSGNALKTTTHTLTAASVAFSGAMSRQVGKTLNASLSFSGAIGRQIRKGLAAVLNFSGSASRQVAHGLTASLSFAGATTKLVHHPLSATLSFAGSFSKTFSHGSVTLTLDNTGSTVNTTNQSAGGTTTLSFTVGSGSNRGLIVSIATWNNGGTGTGCSSVTYGGTSLTAVGNSASSGSFYTEQWYLIAPTSGTANIVATVSGKTDKLGLAAISFSSADQTNPIDVSTSATGTSGTVTASLTTGAANEYLARLYPIEAETASLPA